MIYHYCSSQSFIKIIESGYMKLNDVATMNDRMEGEWGRYIINKIMKNYVNDDKSYSISLRVRSIINKCLLDQFICCFSEECDLLSQWRAYAEDGKGYSIGFDENDISIPKKLPIESDGIERCIGLCQVIYDKIEQEKIIDRYLNNIFSGKDIDENSLQLSKYFTVFKNQAFKEEKEWRIIYTPTITIKNKKGEYNFQIKNKISDYSFNSTKFGISPYFKWAFNDIDPFPIKEVVIGPQNLTHPDNLAFFLFSHKIGKVRISYSDSTYRS